MRNGVYLPGKSTYVQVQRSLKLCSGAQECRLSDPSCFREPETNVSVFIED